eukprot:g1008.t1
MPLQATSLDNSFLKQCASIFGKVDLSNSNDDAFDYIVKFVERFLPTGISSSVVSPVELLHVYRELDKYNCAVCEGKKNDKYQGEDLLSMAIAMSATDKENASLSFSSSSVASSKLKKKVKTDLFELQTNFAELVSKSNLTLCSSGTKESTWTCPFLQSIIDGDNGTGDRFYMNVAKQSSKFHSKEISKRKLSKRRKKRKKSAKVNFENERVGLNCIEISMRCCFAVLLKYKGLLPAAMATAVSSISTIEVNYELFLDIFKSSEKLRSWCTRVGISNDDEKISMLRKRALLLLDLPSEYVLNLYAGKMEQKEKKYVWLVSFLQGFIGKNDNDTVLKCVRKRVENDILRSKQCAERPQWILRFLESTSFSPPAKCLLRSLQGDFRQKIVVEDSSTSSLIKVAFRNASKFVKRIVSSRTLKTIQIEALAVWQRTYYSFDFDTINDIILPTVMDVMKCNGELDLDIHHSVQNILRKVIWGGELDSNFQKKIFCTILHSFQSCQVNYTTMMMVYHIETIRISMEHLDLLSLPLLDVAIEMKRFLTSKNFDCDVKKQALKVFSIILPHIDPIKNHLFCLDLCQTFHLDCVENYVVICNLLENEKWRHFFEMEIINFKNLMSNEEKCETSNISHQESIVKLLFSIIGSCGVDIWPDSVVEYKFKNDTNYHFRGVVDDIKGSIAFVRPFFRKFIHVEGESPEARQQQRKLIKEKILTLEELCKMEKEKVDQKEWGELKKISIDQIALVDGGKNEVRKLRNILTTSFLQHIFIILQNVLRNNARDELSNISIVAASALSDIAPKQLQKITNEIVFQPLSKCNTFVPSAWDGHYQNLDLPFESISNLNEMKKMKIWMNDLLMRDEFKNWEIKFVKENQERDTMIKSDCLSDKEKNDDSDFDSDSDDENHEIVSNDNVVNNEDERIATMVEMGYDKNVVRVLLDRFDDIQMALLWILDHPDDYGEMLNDLNNEDDNEGEGIGKEYEGEEGKNKIETEIDKIVDFFSLEVEEEKQEMKTIIELFLKSHSKIDEQILEQDAKLFSALNIEKGCSVLHVGFRSGLLSCIAAILCGASDRSKFAEKKKSLGKGSVLSISTNNEKVKQAKKMMKKIGKKTNVKLSTLTFQKCNFYLLQEIIKMESKFQRIYVNGRIEFKVQCKLMELLSMNGIIIFSNGTGEIVKITKSMKKNENEILASTKGFMKLLTKPKANEICKYIGVDSNLDNLNVEYQFNNFESLEEKFLDFRVDDDINLIDSNKPFRVGDIIRARSKVESINSNSGAIEALTRNIKIDLKENTIKNRIGFGTARSKVPLNKGIGYFEIQIVSGKTMQVGWATELFSPNSDVGNGVGDDSNSWAFDGSRMKRWTNGNGVTYGSKWKNGDIIGCLLDLNKKEMSFSINGKDLGVAFSNFNDTACYYPAVSLDRGCVKLKCNDFTFRNDGKTEICSYEEVNKYDGKLAKVVKCENESVVLELLE